MTKNLLLARTGRWRQILSEMRMLITRHIFKVAWMIVLIMVIAAVAFWRDLLVLLQIAHALVLWALAPDANPWPN